ncbi:hypothetical protein SDC9_59898 [bioreactor metagenome]|uniref:Zinicin-like metallopeptidase n=1 Tax=bioreactor metagenome TaxID=1076179 RepID=A0A644XCR3_9ZZZZ
MLSFDQVGDLLDEICEKFPPAFFAELNGGVCLLPEAKPDPEAGPELYTMGEYCHDSMGRYINIYYGSFAALAGNLNTAELAEELYATLSHEFTHHMESLAGERGLERKDEAFMEEFWSERDG